MNISSKKNAFETVVVGSGLSGLCMATALSKAGHQVLLLEASELMGGLTRTMTSKAGPLENGLRFLPDSELARRSLVFLSTLIEEEILFESVEREPLTFESGGFRPYVGFGDHSPEFYDEIAYFLNSRELVLQKPMSTWAQSLFSKFNGEFSPRSYVTKFHFGEGKIHSLTINGQKVIQAKNIIYAGPIKDLKTLLPEDVFSSRARQKLTKAKFWTGIGLDLVHHEPQTEFGGIYLLNGTTQDDIGPCVGRFHVAQENLQASQWFSFIDDEDAEDTEKVGAALKKIKRQIKRAFPNAFENLVSERILVAPSMAGNGELKLTAHQTLLDANNFWVASGAVHPIKNVLGTLEQAQLVTSSLGINSLVDLDDITHHAASPVEV